jgi:glycosyltransferase involved in cell wall biosynthesis
MPLVDEDALADIELSIVMPCLNEAETLQICIDKARGYLESSGVVGEIVIADNGSTDGSQDIARKAGARVVPVSARGYGAALIGGITASRGRFVIMADADDSYDFTALVPFVEKLREGHDLVMGNRFKGGIAPGAMPPLHKYLGNPVLSGIGKLFFRPGVGDFHCGLRGFNRERILDLGLQTSGMEFASEMVVKASLAKYDIVEVPTTLKKDGRSRPPHLRSWHDGWRHLRFLLMFAPRWLFLYPGLIALILGVVLSAVLIFTPIVVGGVGFDVSSLLYTSALGVIGYQSVLFWWLTKLYATREGFLPASDSYRKLSDAWTLERGVLLGVALFLLGFIWSIVQVVGWSNVEFGGLDARTAIRGAAPSAVLMIVGFQTILMSFFAGILTIPRKAQPTSSRDHA